MLENVYNIETSQMDIYLLVVCISIFMHNAYPPKKIERP